MPWEKEQNSFLLPLCVTSFVCFRYSHHYFMGFHTLIQSQTHTKKSGPEPHTVQLDPEGLRAAFKARNIEGRHSEAHIQYA